MAKVKIQKKDIWIDMTPMSDVMTLLLCFFMLTSTFLTPVRDKGAYDGCSEHSGITRGQNLSWYRQQELHERYA